MRSSIILTIVLSIALLGSVAQAEEAETPLQIALDNLASEIIGWVENKPTPFTCAQLCGAGHSGGAQFDSNATLWSNTNQLTQLPSECSNEQFAYNKSFYVGSRLPATCVVGCSALLVPGTKASHGVAAVAPSMHVFCTPTPNYYAECYSIVDGTGSAYAPVGFWNYTVEPNGQYSTVEVTCNYWYIDLQRPANHHTRAIEDAPIPAKRTMTLKPTRIIEF